jgi:hypothetical protein
MHAWLPGPEVGAPPALDSVTPGLATGEICLSGSIFVRTLDRGGHHDSVRWPELSCRDAEV